MRDTLRSATLALAAAAICLSCSTAPKNSGVVYQKRDQAVKYAAQADAQFFQGNYSDAISFYQRALETDVAIDYDEGVIASRNAIGRAYAASGLAPEARGEYGKALELAKRSGLAALQAQSLCGMAELELSRGGAEAASSLLAQARALAAKDEATLAIVLHDSGVALKQSGKYEEAAASLQQALAINQRLKRLSEYASNCYALASVYLKSGKAAQAADYAQKALDTDKRTENSLSIATDYYALGKIALSEGKEEDAYYYLGKAFAVELVQNMARESLKSLEELVPLARKLGKEDEAADYEALKGKIQAISEKGTEPAQAAR